MIHDYDPDATYQVYEKYGNSNYKIGEIENNVFYDVDKSGKRTNGFSFSNTNYFWNQFGNIQIKKISKPLDGWEPIVWGVYWTIQASITLVLVDGAQDMNAKIFWLVASVAHYFFTIKYRNNKFVVYWMLITSIVFIIILFLAGSKKRK